MYTWMDATLRDLADLVQQVNEEAQHRNATLSFAMVYPDQRYLSPSFSCRHGCEATLLPYSNCRGEYVMRKVGEVRNSGRSPDAKMVYLFPSSILPLS